MKLLIITVLIMMLIWQGCQSFFPVGEDQKINLNKYDAEDIRLDLADGTEITSNAYAHKLVTEPSDFIMGIAYSYTGLPEDKKEVNIYSSNNFDSVAISKFKNDNYQTCYLKDGSQIHYENNDYLRVRPKDGVGYFIRGEVEKDGIKKIKTSRVELNEIQDVEIQKVDGLKTAGLIILTIFVISGLVFAMEGYHWESSGNGLF